MTICTTPSCDCYAHRLRAKGVQVAPSATPNRVQTRNQPVRPMAEPSWEKGVVGETRPDGSFMPVLAPGTTRPMQVHERQAQRAAVERGLRALKSDPHVLQQKVS